MQAAYLRYVKGPRQQAVEAGLHKGQPVGRVRQVEGRGEAMPLIPHANKAHVGPWLQHRILHEPPAPQQSAQCVCRACEATPEGCCLEIQSEAVVLSIEFC